MVLDLTGRCRSRNGYGGMMPTEVMMPYAYRVWLPAAGGRNNRGSMGSMGVVGPSGKKQPLLGRKKPPPTPTRAFWLAARSRAQRAPAQRLAWRGPPVPSTYSGLGGLRLLRPGCDRYGQHFRSPGASRGSRAWHDGGTGLAALCHATTRRPTVLADASACHATIRRHSLVRPARSLVARAIASPAAVAAVSIKSGADTDGGRSDSP